jgi:hypothetical protein
MGNGPEVVVTIDKDGKVTTEVNGVTGPACLKLTADLVAALGSDPVVTKKAEFHKVVPVAQQQRGNA